MKNPPTLLSQPANQLDALQAAALIRRGELSAVDLMRACLDRIAEREPAVHAFVQLDRDAALAQAHRADAGPVRGLLHGLPMGVKDLFDTCDFATVYGAPAVYSGHRPLADAAAVALCREAGALVIGKTVTTEFATQYPGPTRNPHRLAHTPGGSSSGSAAAVADHMLPLALGTQTAGSLIRPAAYCGVVGFKPSLGRVSRAGVKSGSESLDTVGALARSVRDAALLGAVLTGDERLVRWDTPATLKLGLCRTPAWPEADADIQQAWASAVAVLAPLAAHCAELILPEDFASLVQLQKDLMNHETARALTHERVHHRAQLSAPLRALLDAGMAISGEVHAANLARTKGWRRRSDALFGECDVLLAPSTTGAAPNGLESTGDPLFCRSWTLLGLPCIHLPFARNPQGLPVGLQLVGRFGDDHRLLASAQWVYERLSS